MDLQSGAIEVLPNQGGLNLNPAWSPDGRQVAFISDRTGIPNIFLFDFTDRQHYQLTERARRSLGDHGVQPGDKLGTDRRQTRLHELREGRLHRLTRSQESSWLGIAYAAR